MRPGSQWDINKPVREQDYWDEHARFMDSHFDAGRIILAGPFPDSSGSMIILALENVNEARLMLRDDPWSHHDILVPRDFKEWTIFLDARDRPE